MIGRSHHFPQDPDIIRVVSSIFSHKSVPFAITSAAFLWIPFQLVCKSGKRLSSPTYGLQRVSIHPLQRDLRAFSRKHWTSCGISHFPFPRSQTKRDCCSFLNKGLMVFHLQMKIKNNQKKKKSTQEKKKKRKKSKNKCLFCCDTALQIHI